MTSGIVLYNIELHGCLNGVYTNDECDGEIFNEIAILQEKNTESDEDLCGRYLCTYFELGNKQVNAELLISIKDETQNTYIFNWKVKGGEVFNGIGYKMNEKQIAVHYTLV